MQLWCGTSIRRVSLELQRTRLAAKRAAVDEVWTEYSVLICLKNLRYTEKLLVWTIWGDFCNFVDASVA